MGFASGGFREEAAARGLGCGSDAVTMATSPSAISHQRAVLGQQGLCPRGSRNWVPRHTAQECSAFETQEAKLTRPQAIWGRLQRQKEGVQPGFISWFSPCWLAHYICLDSTPSTTATALAWASVISGLDVEKGAHGFLYASSCPLPSTLHRAARKISEMKIWSHISLHKPVPPRRGHSPWWLTRPSGT